MCWLKYLNDLGNFVVVGVVRRMCSRVVNVSNYVIATCGMGMPSGKLTPVVSL